MDDLGLKNLFGDSGITAYGWLDGGYTYASTGNGLLNVEPRENRFGNEFLANQLAIALEKHAQARRSGTFGFKAIYYAGADAALLHPLGGFEVNDPQFGHDFRDLYLSLPPPDPDRGRRRSEGRPHDNAHRLHRRLAPFRTFYSSDYQWFYHRTAPGPAPWPPSTSTSSWTSWPA